MFQYAGIMHGYNTRYTVKQNFYKSRVRTNVGKQSISFAAINIWKDLPSFLEENKTLSIGRTRNEVISLFSFMLSKLHITCCKCVLLSMFAVFPFHYSTADYLKHKLYGEVTRKPTS